MLDYSLSGILITSDPNDCSAQPENVRSYSHEEILERVGKRGSSLTKADLMSGLELYNNEVADIVADGGAVHTPLFIIAPSIPGVFNGMADSFDPLRHTVKTNLNPGILLRQAATKIKVRKVQVTDPSPYISEVKDIVSNTTNELLTPGGVLQLRGNRLKFFADKPDDGVFFIDDNNVETRCEMIVENKPARIIVMLPAPLASGNYRIELRTTCNSANKEAKNMKKGQFNKILTII
jgi:hypothetical protein